MWGPIVAAGARVAGRALVGSLLGGGGGGGNQGEPTASKWHRGAAEDLARSNGESISPIQADAVRMHIPKKPVTDSMQPKQFNLAREQAEREGGDIGSVGGSAGSSTGRAFHPVEQPGRPDSLVSVNGAMSSSASATVNSMHNDVTQANAANGPGTRIVFPSSTPAARAA